MLVSFVVGLSICLGIGAVAVALAAPVHVPLCRPYTPCGPPASGMSLVNQTVWRSSQFGFRLEYPGSVLAASQQTPAGLALDLQTDAGSGTIVVRGWPASQVKPAQALTAQLGSLGGISQLSADTNPGDQLLGAAVGYRKGIGGTYTGYQDASQGVGDEQTVYAEAASDGRVTVSVMAIGPSSQATPKSALAQAADLVINSIRWT